MSDATDKNEKAALDAKVEKFRQRSVAREAQIKASLMKWLEPRDDAADSVSITGCCLTLPSIGTSRFTMPTASI